MEINSRNEFLIVYKINETKSDNSGNSIVKNNKKPIYLKTILLFLFLTTVGINSSFGFFNVILNSGCLYDLGLNLFFEINKKFQNNLRDYLLIFSSFLVDICIIQATACWIIYAKSWRLIFHLIIFYLPRAIIQKIYNMPFPINYNFDYPGFPSLTVPYGRTNDFFWSGHIAIPLICGYEFKRQGHKILFIFCIFASFVEFFTMLSLSGHYTIDLIFGIIMVLYTYLIVEMFIKFIDNSFMKVNGYA